MDNSNTTTFGLELEFIVHLTEGDSTGPGSQAPKLLELAQCLHNKAPDLPVAAQCDHHDSETCCICADAPPGFHKQKLRVFKAAQPMFHQEGDSEYLYFHVKRETLKIPPNVNGHGFEITSPILDDEELKAGLPQTAQIISAVLNSGLRISAHQACGLHIHVGVKNGMTLNIAKKAVTLAMLLEQPLFTPLSSKARFEDPTWFKHIGKTSAFATNINRQFDSITTEGANRELLEHLPISASELKSAEWNGDNPNKWYLILNDIWCMDNMSQLSKWLRPDSPPDAKASLLLSLRRKIGNSAYGNGASNLNRSDAYEESPSTIEFRYPPMSFDIEFIKNWAEISCKLMEIAKRDTHEFCQVTGNLLKELQTDGEVAGVPIWERLLTVLGLGHQIDFWKEQLKRFEENEIIWFNEKVSQGPLPVDESADQQSSGKGTINFFIQSIRCCRQ
ncbi:hypothetical protein V8C35DRAFT_333971 [Trichoderma chlorosporum]